MPSAPDCWAVVVAAGRSERFGSGMPKQFVEVGGRPLLLWAAEPFLSNPAIAGVTVVLPADYAGAPPSWLAGLRARGVVLVAGGPERTDSVRRGLATLPPGIGFVAVHDGARPLISVEMIERVRTRATSRRGAIAARPVADSLKQADPQGRVLRSLERRDLWRAETPQVFPSELIVDVHRRAQADGITESDCAALCERYGIDVLLVEIDEPNLKVTQPRDLELAEAWIEWRRQRSRERSQRAE